MIKPNIRQIAEKNGITTAYQLQKLLGIQPSMAAKWYRNDLKMIGFDSLNVLCKAFNCSPSDLIVYTPDAGADTPNDTKASNVMLGNSLQSITALSSTESDNETLMDGLPALEDESDRWLSTKQVAEYTGRKVRTVSDFYNKEGLRREITAGGSFVQYSVLVEFLKNRKKTP